MTINDPNLFEVACVVAGFVLFYIFVSYGFHRMSRNPQTNETNEVK